MARKDAQICVRLTEELMERLVRQTSRYVVRSDVVRRYVLRGLAADEAEAATPAPRHGASGDALRGPRPPRV